ncbi:MAG: PfkB family carbohydrate kinase [Steroidobacteraceae bacterium]
MHYDGHCIIVGMPTGLKGTWLWTDVRRIAALGEPLIELQPIGDGNLRVSFGGDVANTMVCLKRILRADDFRLAIITALGDSLYSAWLRDRLVRERIKIVEPPLRGEPGVYGISPDFRRQSTSSYWRGQSAARQFLHSAKLAQFEELLDEPQIVIITGITLALCSAASFKNLCDWIELHLDQCRIVFDSNFRPALWASAKEAAARIGALERLAATIATSLEDERLLWQAAGVTQVVERLGALSAEYIIRGGSEGCWAGAGKHWDHVPATSATVVDSVGAGDAHLAGYIAARVKGLARLDAARAANRVAAMIVSQHGSMPAEDAVFPNLVADIIDGSAAST